MKKKTLTQIKSDNVKTIRRGSYGVEEIAYEIQQLALADARVDSCERALTSFQLKIAKFKEKIKQQRETLDSKPTDARKLALHKSLEVLKELKEDHFRVNTELRESKNIRKEQKVYTAAIQKKELARQKAVAKFLREWEKDYDTKYNMVKMRIDVRKNNF